MIAVGDAQLYVGYIGAPSQSEPPVGGELDLSGPDAGVRIIIGSTLAHPEFEPYARSARYMLKRHGGMWNVGFCDGHVQGLRPMALWDFREEQIVRRWNRDHQGHMETASILGR